MRKFLLKFLLYTFIIAILGYGIIYVSLVIQPEKMLGSSNEYALWKYKKKMINMPFYHKKNVIIGDSRSMTGINPLITGHNLINLSLTGTTAFEGYSTLKQFLVHHQIDTLIVSYGIFHYIESDVLDKWTLPFTLPSIEDVNMLEKLERQYGITINNEKPGYWLYLKRKATYFHVPLLFRSTFIENIKQGSFSTTVMYQLQGMAGFSNVSTEDSCNVTDTEVEMEQKYKKLIINPVIASYIDSIYTLSAKKGIKVIFLIPPINKASYTVLQHTLFFRQYLSFKENLKTSYPEMIIDNKYMYLPNHYFHDSSHLNQRGVIFFSNYIREEMKNY